VLRASECVSLAYFAALIVASWISPLPWSRRAIITGAGGAMMVSVTAIAWRGVTLERDWMPLAIILVGYYLSAKFFVQPSKALERWLSGWDARLLGDVGRFAAWPAPVVDVLELAYMCTFLLLPLGCLVLGLGGHEDAVSRYWTLVTTAEFASFVTLVWVHTRPPWAVERLAPPRSLVRRLGLFWVARTSHRVNTFPSGHAAGSLAVALAVMAAMPVAGTLLLVVALTISVASVVGRYHYAVDVVSGVALTLLLWAVLSALGV
jgi:membrane-associated phospholipid phosphatase